ncbi:MAG: hypothetical protein A4E65_02454 [Syntrophorhabdus sp. PtaU1.Bin153]|nr:MAG: hypothetical protein A4E65_02454 [Syntrophorhabdus sp. PtaU1.Bin153]
MTRTRAICAALACGLSLAAAATLYAAEEKGPVGLWKFDGDPSAVLKDSSGNGNDAKFSHENHPDITSVPGKSGNGLEFKGEIKGSGVIVPGFCKKYNFFPKGLTIETWIKFSDPIVSKWQMDIVSNGSGDMGKGFRLKYGGQWLYLITGDGTKTWGTHQNEIKYPFKPSVWYFIAAVYDGESFKIYIDGELAGTPTKGELPQGMDDLYIGCYKGGYAYRFIGIIDEVKVYDYARTDAQILSDARTE